MIEQNITPDMSYNQDFNKYLFWIRKSAKKIASQFNNKLFTIDELVNEAWIRGRNSNRPNKSEFVQRAYWDMKDYVREEIGRENTAKAKFKFITNMHDDNDGNPIQIFDKITLNEDLKTIENNELVEKIFQIPNTRNTNMMISYYMDGKSLKEIGQENNITESTTCNALKRTISKIQEHPEMEEYMYCNI